MKLAPEDVVPGLLVHMPGVHRLELVLSLPYTDGFDDRVHDVIVIERNLPPRVSVFDFASSLDHYSHSNVRCLYKKPRHP